MKDKILSRFVIYIALITFIYKLYILRTLNFVMDEFVEVHISSLLHQGLSPYVDFTFAKPILLQFLLLPIFHLTSSPIDIMLFSRFLMLILSLPLCIIIYLIAKEKYNDRAGWFAVLLVTLCSTQIERSLKIRTDNITVLLFMISIAVNLVGPRRLWKEIVSGSSLSMMLLTTQKSIYFVAAMIFVIGWRLLIEKNLTAKGFLFIIIGMLSPIIIWLTYIGIFSDLHSVIEQTIFSVSSHLTGNVFRYNFDGYYWTIFKRDPLFWSLSIIALAYRLVKTKLKDERTPLHWAATMVIVGFIYHNVPWPYFFVTMIPLLAIVLGAELDIVYSKRNSKLKQVGFLICLLAFFAVGIIFFRLQKLSIPTNTVQVETIEIAEDLLEIGDTYFDGVWMLLNRKPADPINLVAGNIQALSKDSQLTHRLLDNLEKNKCALIINNYRTRRLPSRFQTFFQSHYLHITGNIFTSGAKVQFDAKGCKQFKLIGSGNYGIIPSSKSSEITIDGNIVQNEIVLEAGHHTMCVDRGPISVVSIYYRKGAKLPQTKHHVRNLFISYLY